MFFALLLWNMAELSLSLADEVCTAFQRQIMKTVVPYAAFKTGGQTEKETYEAPIFVCPPYISYAVSNIGFEQKVEDGYFYELLLESQNLQTQDVLAAMEEENRRAQDMLHGESAEEKTENNIEEGGEEGTGEDGKKNETGTEDEVGEKEEMQAGGETNGNTEEPAEAMGQQVAASGFIRATEKQQTFDWNQYEDFNVFLQEFYAVDSTTKADAKLLKPKEMLEKNLAIDKNSEGYQILIFHTHSQEAFADSVEGDKSTTIVGVGDYMTEILQEEYGYKVLHHTGEYDVEYRDKAYSKALPAIEEVLAEHPEIQVVLDLHRDEVAEGTKLVTEIQGKPTAKFMFFNGLSYTNQTGAIDYLENPNLADNLAFSFQMQVVCNEYFPGLTRRIYLKGYRYNMHLKDKYLLVEMGAQTNTVEEVKNACNPLAQALDKVLSGMVY